jgi:hypothetical protein
MRDHARISPRFWIGSTGRAIRNGGHELQVVAFYLMTAPSSNMIGLYYLPIPMISHDTGVTLEGASKALQSLSEAGFAHYDRASETVWVVEMATWQTAPELLPTDNRVKGVVSQLEPYKRYRVAYHLPELSPSEGASKPLRSKEKEKEKEKEQAVQSAKPEQAKFALAVVPVVEQPLPGKPSPVVDRWRIPAEKVLDYFSDTRCRVIPGARRIRATSDALHGIASRLEDGHTLEECMGVVDTCAAEIRAGGEAKWFNTETTFRPKNFQRKLEMDPAVLAKGKQPERPEPRLNVDGAEATQRKLARLRGEA